MAIDFACLVPATRTGLHPICFSQYGSLFNFIRRRDLSQPHLVLSKLWDHYMWRCSLTSERPPYSEFRNFDFVNGLLLHIFLTENNTLKAEIMKHLKDLDIPEVNVLLERQFSDVQITEWFSYSFYQ